LDAARLVKRKLRLDCDRGARARLDDFATETRQSVAARNSERVRRIELGIDAEHLDAVFETRRLCKAIGKIHQGDYRIVRPARHIGSLRFRVHRGHPFWEATTGKNRHEQPDYCY